VFRLVVYCIWVIANVDYSALGTQALLESVVHYDQTKKDAEGA